MSKHKKPDESAQLNSTKGKGLDKTSERPTELELLKDFDESRRSFLKKLLISAAYITPAVLSFSMSDAEARRRRRRRPTKKARKRRKKRRQRRR
ncbi:MAG: hypothetical protein MAG551_00770 [Candidatus Scalindua arabica]|uniref:Uncharacterized protein n=1 Tax=Candidatus Scalindua arabica TaxID=1127984 RepID=A0A941W4A5_9BACT|nr:hypothetical protein [Candidatus Scalindua arabica]